MLLTQQVVFDSKNFTINRLPDCTKSTSFFARKKEHASVARSTHVVNIASVGMLATGSEAIPQRNELWSEEVAERRSQAHNGSGSRMRCNSAVTSASAGRRGAEIGRASCR